MMHTCSNGRLLVLSTPDSYIADLANLYIPFAVLLPSNLFSETARLQEFVEKLLNEGTTTFSVIGEHSESIHDKIDDIIVDAQLEDADSKAGNSITTWHSHNDIDDATAYFVYATEPTTDQGQACLLAIVEDRLPEGDLLRKKLLEM